MPPPITASTASCQGPARPPNPRPEGSTLTGKWGRGLAPGRSRPRECGGSPRVSGAAAAGTPSLRLLRYGSGPRLRQLCEGSPGLPGTTGRAPSPPPRPRLTSGQGLWFAYAEVRGRKGTANPWGSRAGAGAGRSFFVFPSGGEDGTFLFHFP